MADITRTLQQIPVASIRPNPQQPRAVFDEEGLRGLADSMAEEGLIQPIEVEQRGDGTYMLHHGERRWRAAQLLGWSTIEALVISQKMPATRRRMRALLENLQRQDMRPTEVGRCYQELLNAGMNRVAIARKTGHSPETIAAYLRILELPGSVQERVDVGDLPMDRRVSSALLGISDEKDRERLALKLAQPGQTIAGILHAVDTYQKLKQETPAQRANGHQRAPRADCGQSRAAASNLAQVLWGGCPPPTGKIYEVAEAVCRKCVFASDAPTLACQECQLLQFVRLYEE